jgi:hypothetical protein
MPRSAGITISAVVVFFGSALTILSGALMMLASVVISHSERADLPANVRYVLIIETILFVVFGGWGVATGVGLINTKQWARISMFVFAAFLAFVSIPTAALMAFIKFPVPDDPNFPGFTMMIKVGLVLFYAAFGALGCFWLYFFNRKNVKAQFEGKHVAELATPDLPWNAASAAGRVDSPARPISITIIGWCLIVFSAFAPMSLLFSKSIFPDVALPICFLGFFFFGRSAYLILFLWMAAQLVAAVGLLNLKNWGRLATIGLQCLSLVNFALMAGIPANRERLQRTMETIASGVNARMPQPQPLPFAFPMWIGAATAIPIAFVILWFLITKKQAFASSARDLSGPL